MVNPRQSITIQGEGVELLITPSMYKVALSRGLDLTLHNPKDEAEIWEIYLKHVYLAYRNALDVAAYDGAAAPEKTFTLADFQVWAVGEGKARFGQLIRDIVYLKTGKTLDDLADAGDGKKKATPKPRRRFPFWSRGKNGVTS